MDRWIGPLDRAGIAALEEGLRAGLRLGLRRCPLPLPPALLLPLFHEAEEPSLRRWLAPDAAPLPACADFAVSVVIPMLQRPWGLAGWLAQDVPVELILISNGGYDGADLSALGDPRVRVLQLPWQGHGATRQQGVRAARNPFVLLTVDDAIPCGAGVLRRMVDALAADPAAAVITARQIPWPGADPVTRRRLLGWCPPGDGPQPAARIDHVAALYRRAALESAPIPDAPIAEDWHQARRLPPGSLRYHPGAPVLHSHPRHLRPLLSRTRAIHREFIAAGAPPAVPDLPHMIRALPSILGRDLPGALGELIGQWQAARDCLR